MAITIEKILKELGKRAWSGFNKDDMTFTNEDAETAIAEINTANRYLQSLEDFPYQTKKTSISTIANESEYKMVDGQIKDIVNKEKESSLSLITSLPNPKEAEGTPTSYYIKYEIPNVKIVLYPTPSVSNKIFDIYYNNFKFIIDNKGNELNEFSKETDLINLPSYIEYLYMDCLILRVMSQNNKDIADENYQPILNELKETWTNFKRKAQPVIRDIFIRI